MEELSVGSVRRTGCDGGLGLGLLKGLLEQTSPPQHLFAACLDPQGKPSCPRADVTDPNSIKAAVRKVQEEVGSAGLNLLINNAGTTRCSTLATETAENMTLVYTTNTIAALNMLTKCLALEYGGSGILCVSVDPGCVTPPLGQGTGPVTVEESVQGVLRLLARLSASSNGTFWDWRGQSLPW
ncbi:C-factor-like [Egretta garzetta]|uniref:C-factor-like n=1 Tax=Egretta garzetta TaxID=188379 RepID=UPI00051F1629|nr:C-factor-like [Egretta garzetta]